MRWSNEQLEAHLNAHRNKVNLAQERQKKENDAKVLGRIKTRLKLKSEPIVEIEQNLILDAEIWMIPPSVNKYWGVKGKKRFLSERAEAFHAYVQTIVPNLYTNSRLKLDVIFYFPDRKRRDIDNYLKATIDSLVKCGFCVDDEQFDELAVRRGEVVKGGLIKLKVMELKHGHDG